MSLPPANEVSEGNVFTGVCLSTEGGPLSRDSLSEGSLSGGSLSRGVFLSGGRVFLSRGVCPGGFLSGLPIW